ncbi:hypothetical protein EVAR_42842_1 [Eumeta japonica]|uniref:Uncharacterized protein n=1 Tax=Eumeta variegata TaxID=151549 RepID=A0A4C1WG78_EUMVA|nr:hypothetical protein EVAR_42842_1 [Eumeta japonica]
MQNRGYAANFNTQQGMRLGHVNRQHGVSRAIGAESKAPRGNVTETKHRIELLCLSKHIELSLVICTEL